MSSKDSQHPWPERLKPGTAARMLDVSESTFRIIWPILAAHHGLMVSGVAGPKFARGNLLAVLASLADKGLDIRLDKASGVVWIGSRSYPITSSRSGHSRRGRPPKAKGGE